MRIDPAEAAKNFTIGVTTPTTPPQSTAFQGNFGDNNSDTSAIDYLNSAFGGSSSGNSSNASGSNASGSSNTQGQMSFAQVLTVLNRHLGLLSSHGDNKKQLEKLLNDKNTPDDEKAALRTVLNNPSYFAKLDGGNQKGNQSGKHLDGKFSSKDVHAMMQKDSAAQSLQSSAAKSYTQNYVPSDAPPGALPRKMSENDAMRELFNFSQSLPKNLDLKTLQKIADGTQKDDKAPPQLQAAAQYFVDHPAQWSSFTQGAKNGKVSTDRMCDLAAQQVKFSPQEQQTLQTLQNNQDIFFKHGGLTKSKLDNIANDSSYSPAVRQAATQLAQPHSMLFEMLDNGKHGAGGNAWDVANDGNIGKGDLAAFLKHTQDLTATPDTPSILSGKFNASAASDMETGQETQPDDKKEKGGGFKKFLEGLGEAALAVVSFIIPGGEELGGLADASIDAATDAALGAGSTAAKGAAAITKEGLKEGIDQGEDQAESAIENQIQGGSNDSSSYDDQGVSPTYAQS